MSNHNSQPDQLPENEQPSAGDFYHEFFKEMGKSHLLPLFEQHKDIVQAFVQIAPVGLARLVPEASKPSFEDEGTLLESLIPYIDTLGYILQSVVLMTEEQLAAFWLLLENAGSDREPTPETA